MHLAKISIDNFRIFGTGDDCLTLSLHPKLTLIVGENDSGKTAVIDAIRFVLGTSDLDYVRLTIDDFHLSYSKNEDGQIVAHRAETLRIECLFENLSIQEAAMFLEWLGIEEKDGNPHYFLRVWLEARREESRDIDGKITVNFRAGSDDEGMRFDGEARRNLRATYLRPLRDAEREMSSRRGSRLSKILYAHVGPESENPEGGQKIVDIVRSANSQVKDDETVQEPLSSLRQEYFNKLQLQGGEGFYPDVAIADPNLRSILEQLQLLLSDINGVDENTKHGLGVNNLLFMSAELLLLSSLREYSLPMLLIEEPEAHLHPQLQNRLIHFLKDNEQEGVQVVMTSHSPNLASSLDLEHLIIMKNGHAYPLAPQYTELDPSDYGFLQRFLDVTKANLFFARGVLIVEGDAEYILLPTIAKLLQRPLDEYGVTVVNVGHTGLFRYARIFQRKDGGNMRVKVACLADLDVPSEFALDYQKPPQQTEKDYDLDQKKKSKKERLGGSGTKAFSSTLWTLEHDFCLKPDFALLMWISIQLAKSEALDKRQTFHNACDVYDTWVSEGLSTKEIAAKIYEPLYEKRASKAETAQHFAELLENDFQERDFSTTEDGDFDESSEEFLRYVAGFPDYIVDAIEHVTSSINRNAT